VKPKALCRVVVRMGPDLSMMGHSKMIGTSGEVA